MRQIPEEYVVKLERDILEAEGIFVHTPSVFAKDNLFYVRLEALYTCGPQYEVRRAGLDSFLLFFIREGEMLFEYEGRSFAARKKDIVLLDCMQPHRYKALTRTEFYWFHFDGSASRAYFDHFRENKGLHFREQRNMEENFVLIHDLMRSGCPDEGAMSVHVHRILALLFSSVGKSSAPSDIIARARVYMDEHYMEKLSAEQIAEASHENAAEYLILRRGDRRPVCFLLLDQFHPCLPAEHRRHTPQIPKADQRHHLRRSVT